MLKQLSFTIRQIGKATSGMDLSWQYISGCKFVGVSAVGTPDEHWMFLLPGGREISVSDIKVVEAFTLN
jgi:hypothetical protein